jgi:large subunit ribosomal protein L21
MYAIFESGSHQFRVREGEKVTIDRRPEDVGTEITFDKVLLIAGGEGEPVIGAPVIEGATVVARVLREYRGKKIVIRKFRRRKGYRRKRGHRQYYTDVQIVRIVPA